MVYPFGEILPRLRDPSDETLAIVGGLAACLAVTGAIYLADKNQSDSFVPADRIRVCDTRYPGGATVVTVTTQNFLDNPLRYDTNLSSCTKSPHSDLDK
ncbi:hypothetical protein CR983_02130 [Candidatus Saccharibacteria bacterium]|nr:MAG: hypothetical protein CR983_02130 [Candidatus Saccharibacteria bacterium]